MAEVIDYVSLKPGDFLSDDDFQVWDAALCGAYCRIIFYLYKNNGRVKNDQDHLRGLANWQGPNWDEAWTKLFPKFRVRGNNLIHKRVADELRRAKKRMQDKSAAGRKGADVRWQKHGNRNASAMPSNVMVREENNNPPTPQGDSRELPGFNAFWDAFPNPAGRKKGNPQCKAKWKELGLEERTEEVLASLERWKTSKPWAKDRGAFVPGPHPWLHQASYEEDPPQADHLAVPQATPEQQEQQRVAQEKRQAEQMEIAADSQAMEKWWKAQPAAWKTRQRDADKRKGFSTPDMTRRRCWQEHKETQT